MKGKCYWSLFPEYPQPVSKLSYTNINCGSLKLFADKITEVRGGQRLNCEHL